MIVISVWILEEKLVLISSFLQQRFHGIIGDGDRVRISPSWEVMPWEGEAMDQINHHHHGLSLSKVFLSLSLTIVNAMTG